MEVVVDWQCLNNNSKLLAIAPPPHDELRGSVCAGVKLISIIIIIAAAAFVVGDDLK